MSDDIDISGLEKSEVLAELYNGTMPLGLGFLHDLGRPMTKEEAQKHIENTPCHNGVMRFDYVCGKPIKIGFKENKITHVWLYDRDTYEGKCLEIVNNLKKKNGLL